MNISNVYLLIVLSFILGSCNHKNQTSTKPKSVQEINLYLIDSILNNHKLDDRVQILLDNLFSKYDTVMSVYSPECWIENCSSKGFIVYGNNNNYNVIFYRLKRIYQKIPPQDSVVFLSTLFQYKKIKSVGISNFEYSKTINEYLRDTLPYTGDDLSSHEKTYFIFIKSGARFKKIYTRSTYNYIAYKNLHRSLVLHVLDSSISNLFRKNNIDTLSPLIR